MAEIVAAFGVPHTPMFPSLVEREGPNCETARLYGAVRAELEAVAPDAVVVFDSDHLNTFFYNNMPTFCVGVAERTVGPNDSNTGLPRRTLTLSEDLAHRVHEGLVAQGFDPAQSQEFEVDHSVLVPLHFLTPRLDTPVVPLFINGLAPPLPSARRCLALGGAVRAAVESWPRGMRVAVLASGSFSLEVGGPKGERYLDSEWMDTVVGCLEQGRSEELCERATFERMQRAGNIGGELLNWIAVLGAAGHRRPAFVERQPGYGHAYAAWRWDRGGEPR
jgi:aromatic ring-opening dioxygenase catalytic subunit (LigB family)